MDWSRIEVKSVGGLLLKNGYHYNVNLGTLEYNVYDGVLTFEYDAGFQHIETFRNVSTSVILDAGQVIGIEMPVVEGAHA